MSVVCCDWAAAALLLRVDKTKTSWCFLSELELNGVLPGVATFARNTTQNIEQARAGANRMLQSGILGKYEEMLAICSQLEAERSRMMSRFESTLKRDRTFREEWGRAEMACHTSDAMETLAPRVAASMKHSHHAIIDGFLPSAADVGELLRAMHTKGELLPGKVRAGVNASQRSDLMAWVPAAADQPPALRQFLSQLDRLVLALVRQPQLKADFSVPLVRAEAQCTCYPGSGSHYVKHTDDTSKKVRKLTCILYANPGWVQEAGGELRLHLPGETLDVAPLDNRLVLFWSDTRVPHEVRPTHAARYAVSIWYHDGSGESPCTIPARGVEAVAVRQIEGKGLGVVALRDLRAGECVLAELPLVAWHVASGASGRVDVAELDAIVESLGDEARREFFDLVDVHGSSLTFSTTGKIAPQPDSPVTSGSGFDEKTAAGIWASNAFALEAGDCFTPADDGVVRAACFKTCSRLNHSCAPSCYIAWNPKRGRQMVHTLRDIHGGEELTIACACAATSNSRPCTSSADAHDLHSTCSVDRRRVQI